jgi:hypothetical protein
MTTSIKTGAISSVSTLSSFIVTYFGIWMTKHCGLTMDATTQTWLTLTIGSALSGVVHGIQHWFVKAPVTPVVK